jgi:hypothetical protein
MTACSETAPSIGVSGGDEYVPSCGAGRDACSLIAIACFPSWMLDFYRLVVKHKTRVEVDMSGCAKIVGDRVPSLGAEFFEDTVFTYKPLYFFNGLEVIDNKCLIVFGIS